MPKRGTMKTDMDDKDFLDQYCKLVDRQTEVLERIRDQADKEITRAWRAYALLGTLVATILAAGIFTTYNSLSEFQSSIKDDILSQKDIVQRNVTMQIEKEFNKENITGLVVAEAQKRIDAVAEDIIEKQIRAVIDPEVTRTRNDLDELAKQTLESSAAVKEISDEMKEKNKSIDENITNLGTAMSKAAEAQKNMEQTTAFAMTLLAAQNDSWKAFLQLQAWGDDKSYPLPLKELAFNACLEIRISYAERIKTQPGHALIPWPAGVVPETIPLEDLDKLYTTPTLKPLFHVALVDFVWNRADFPRKRRMEFLLRVLQTSDSIRARYYAGKLFESAANDTKLAANDTKLKWEPFKIDLLLAWWTTHEKEIQ